MTLAPIFERVAAGDTDVLLELKKTYRKPSIKGCVR